MKLLVSHLLREERTYIEGVLEQVLRGERRSNRGLENITE
jgi:hypothetical protein